MISCERCEELINARLDGDLTEEDALLLEAHLEGCPDCQKLDRDLTDLHKRLKALSFDPPSHLASSVMAQLEPEFVPTAKKKKRTWPAAICAAAVILLVVTISPQILPFGYSEGDTAAAESAAAPEAPATAEDAAPTEGAAGGATREECQTDAETEEYKSKALTEAQALTILEEYLSQQDRSLAIDPGTLSADGGFWTFPARDPVAGQKYLYTVHCTDALVEETMLP